jgi:hypothetical protein
MTDKKRVVEYLDPYRNEWVDIRGDDDFFENNEEIKDLVERTRYLGGLSVKYEDGKYGNVSVE